jgi:hypothetical protein
MWHVWGTGELHKGRRPPARPRCRWKGNIKVNLQKVEWEATDWIAVAEDRDKWRAPVNALTTRSVP